MTDAYQCRSSHCESRGQLKALRDMDERRAERELMKMGDNTNLTSMTHAMIFTSEHFILQNLELTSLVVRGNNEQKDNFAFCVWRQLFKEERGDSMKLLPAI